MRLHWLSLGYGLKRDDFKLFDDTLPVSQQIRSTFYVSHQANAAFTKYQFKKDNNIVLWSLNATLNYTSNLNSLSKVTLVDTEIISSNDVMRESISEQSVFKGRYTEDITQVNVSWDYYHYFFENKLGLHLRPRTTFQEDIKPIHSILIGFIAPFKDKKNKNSLVNFELFYRFNDTSNTLGASNSLLASNTIGIATTLPFRIPADKK